MVDLCHIDDKNPQNVWIHSFCRHLFSPHTNYGINFVRCQTNIIAHMLVRAAKYFYVCNRIFDYSSTNNKAMSIPIKMRNGLLSLKF